MGFIRCCLTFRTVHKRRSPGGDAERDILFVVDHGGGVARDCARTGAWCELLLTDHLGATNTPHELVHNIGLVLERMGCIGAHLCAHQEIPCFEHSIKWCGQMIYSGAGEGEELSLICAGMRFDRVLQNEKDAKRNVSYSIGVGAGLQHGAACMIHAGSADCFTFIFIEGQRESPST